MSTLFWIHFISHLLTFPAGRSGCGKSFLLLQFVKHRSSAGWIIIYIPRAVNLVNSTTEYLYDIRTQTYLQTKFAFQTLQRTLTVNSELLGSIQLHEDLELEKLLFPAGTPLSNVIRGALGARTRKFAQSPVFYRGCNEVIRKTNSVMFCCA